MAALPGMRERTITISSFGKTFSLTGWKIGWAAAPPPLTAAVRAAHQFITFATATPLQHAAPRRSRSARSTTGRSPPPIGGKRDYLVAERPRLGFRVGRPPARTSSAPTSGPRLRRRRRVLPPPDREDRRRRDSALRVFYENKRHGKTYARFAFCKRDETLRGRRLRRARSALRGRPGEELPLPITEQSSAARMARACERIALVQMDIAWEDAEENHRRAARHARGGRRARRAARHPARDVLDRLLDGRRERDRAAARAAPRRPSCVETARESRPLDPRRAIPRGGGAARRATWRSSFRPRRSRDALREDPSLLVRAARTGTTTAGDRVVTAESRACG